MTTRSLRAPRRFPSEVAEYVAALAVDALSDELQTWPKPGLVSHIDEGSHKDMDAGTFRASIAAIGPFYGELAAAGARASPMNALRTIGIRAEAAMLEATGGINTHRGAIFGLGLLCAAAGAHWRERPWTADGLCRTVSRTWGRAILSGPIPLASHGTKALLRHGAGGARVEAAEGFPSVLNVGLPTLRLARALVPSDPEAARVQAFFALLATVHDTNLLHRGGADGSQFAGSAAAGFLDEGGVSQPDWRDRAASIHRAFVERRLSPGGCADLLTATLFLDALEHPQ